MSGLVKANKNFREFVKYSNVGLLKKSRGMILGLTEICEGLPTMKYSAVCCSPSAEVYVLTKQVLAN